MIRDLQEQFHAIMVSALASAIYFVGSGSFTFAIFTLIVNYLVSIGRLIDMPEITRLPV